MLEQSLKLMGGRMSVAPDAIMLHDGDALEIRLIRDGAPLAMLHMEHRGVNDDGSSRRVAPLPIQIIIERADGQIDEERARQFQGWQGVIGQDLSG